MIRTVFTLLSLSALLSLSPEALASADSGLVGAWQLRVEGRMGIQTPILEIREQDGHFSGRIGNQRGKVDIERIAVDGDKFSFPFTMKTPMREFTLQYQGTRSGDTLSGSVQAPSGPVPFTGSRKTE